MKVFEASIHYRLISSGNAEPLDLPEQAAEYMEGAFDAHPTQESFYVICLNKKMRPLGRSLITIGTRNSTLHGISEVFRPAILQSASSIILCHNHPSGDPTPSREDFTVTRRYREAAKILEIELLDHIIIGNTDDDPCNVGYFSFRSAGHL